MSIKSLIETIKKDGILRASGSLEELYKLATENESQLTALTSQLESVVAENAALKDAMRVTLEHVSVMDTGQAGVAAMIINDALHNSETPATDAILAEVRASGVEMAAKSEQFSTWVQQGLRSFAIGVRQGGAV